MDDSKICQDFNCLKNEHQSFLEKQRKLLERQTEVVGALRRCEATLASYVTNQPTIVDNTITFSTFLGRNNASPVNHEDMSVDVDWTSSTTSHNRRRPCDTTFRLRMATNTSQNDEPSSTVRLRRTCQWIRASSDNRQRIFPDLLNRGNENENMNTNPQQSNPNHQSMFTSDEDVLLASQAPRSYFSRSNDRFRSTALKGLLARVRAVALLTSVGAVHPFKGCTCPGPMQKSKYSQFKLFILDMISLVPRSQFHMFMCDHAAHTNPNNHITDESDIEEDMDSSSNRENLAAPPGISNPVVAAFRGHPKNLSTPLNRLFNQIERRMNNDLDDHHLDLDPTLVEVDRSAELNDLSDEITILPTSSSSAVNRTAIDLDRPSTSSVNQMNVGTKNGLSVHKRSISQSDSSEDDLIEGEDDNEEEIDSAIRFRILRKR
uniref:Uncharacterized protein n=1 Tax=Romanomermis culicivorax TaxID=13658 RepID=A0A915IJ43_ROMCU